MSNWRDRPELLFLHLELGGHLDRILRAMPPGYKVTLVLRNPVEQAAGRESEVVIGDDSLTEAAAAIARAIGEAANDPLRKPR